MLKKLHQWLDDQVGIEAIIRKVNDEPIRGGARWAYVFGSAVLLMLMLQAATGIVLTLYYVPSSDHAHASVAYIQKVVAGGSLVRGLHYYGSNVIVLLVVVHFVQTFLFGAYKERRELLWWSGLLMFGLVLAFGFTGYLLPWTQEAYFGTKVGTSIAGEIPGIGSVLQRILLGGRELTTLTLSRFFTLHVFLLPLLLLLLAVLHVALFRKAGAAGPYHHREDARIERFYPKQMFMDALLFFVIFVGLVLLSIKIPAVLGSQADPTGDYLARPPWYFLPLLQLLKYFSGRLALLPTVVLPGVAFVVLALLPVLDRRKERHPRRRPLAIVLLGISLLGTGGLIALSKYQDTINPETRAKFESQHREEQAYLRAPFQPEQIGRTIPVEVPTVPALAEVRNPVLKIYVANCANCHGRDASGGPLAPSLIRHASSRRLSKEYLVNYIAGHTRERGPDSMPLFNQLTHDQRAQLAEWLLQLKSPQQLIEAREIKPKPTVPARHPKTTGASVAVSKVEEPPPPEAFSKTCAFCHGNQARGNIGPSLIGITSKPQRTPEDLLKLLDDPRAFDLKDPMPASFPKLTPEEKKAIVDWLAKLQ